MRTTHLQKTTCASLHILLSSALDYYLQSHVTPMSSVQRKTISMHCVCLTPPNLTLQGIESTTIRVGKYKIKFGKGERSQCAVLALWSFRVTFDRGLHAHLPCCWHTPIQCGDSPVSGAVLVQMKTTMQTAPLMVRDLHSP